MPNNNPGGANGTSYFEGFQDETAYGAVKRLSQLTQAAPPPKPQRKTARQQQQAAPPPPAPPAPPEWATAWAEVAQIPGINTELVSRFLPNA